MLVRELPGPNMKVLIINAHVDDCLLRLTKIFVSLPSRELPLVNSNWRAMAVGYIFIRRNRMKQLIKKAINYRYITRTLLDDFMAKLIFVKAIFIYLRSIYNFNRKYCDNEFTNHCIYSVPTTVFAHDCKIF